MCSTVQITEPIFTDAKVKTFTWKCTCSVNQSISAAVPCHTAVGLGPNFALLHQYNSGITAMTPISLRSGKRKANENRFLPRVAAAEQVTEGSAAASCFIVTLITPQAAEVMLVLESHSAEGFLSKQATSVLESSPCKGCHSIPIAVGHAEKNRHCLNSSGN